MLALVANLLLPARASSLLFARHTLPASTSQPSILDDATTRWKSVLDAALAAIRSNGEAVRSFTWWSPLSLRSSSSAPANVMPTQPHPDSGPSDRQPLPPTPDAKRPPDSIIMRLMNNPALRDPIRAPRHPIVLCHGLYGFDVLGPSAYPSLQIHYWHDVTAVLKKVVGANVIVTGVPSVGSIESRANKLHELLAENAPGQQLNFLAHSMGGLDCRHLITHVQPSAPAYEPVSLTTVCAPHRGSPFMDWCRANIGIGDLRRVVDAATSTAEQTSLPYTLKAPLLSRAPQPPSSEAQATTIASRLSTLPASLTTLILSMLDAPAYSDLTTSYCNNVFNPSTPPRPGVKYFSVGARQDKMRFVDNESPDSLDPKGLKTDWPSTWTCLPSYITDSIFHPLWLPKIILDESEAAERKALQSSPGSPDGRDGNPASNREWGNDGLVTIHSARYGEWLGVVDGCDHWDMRGANSMSKSWVDERAGWMEFFGARKRAAAAASAQDETSSSPPPVSLDVTSATDSLVGEKQSETHDDGLEHALRQIQEDKQMSAVAHAQKSEDAFQWLASKVPAPTAMSALSSSFRPSNNSLAQSSARQQISSRFTPRPQSPSPSTSRPKFDLETFYIALARNLYDNGL